MRRDEAADQAIRVRQYARTALSPSRFEHSERVAGLAVALCGRFGVDPDAGYLAGIAHDMCKAGKERLLLSLAARDGLPLSPIEEEKPSLLHGRAAAVVLESDFGVSDRSVLEAVRHHTFGSPTLDSLGLIVFVADKLEPGRDGIDVGWRERTLSLGLNAMAAAVVRDNVRYLEEKGKTVSSETREMLALLLRGRNSA